MVVSPVDVIFNYLTIRGFSMRNPEFAGAIPEVISLVSDMVASHQISVPVAAVYRLEDIGDVIAQAEKGGKVLLKVPD